MVDKDNMSVDEVLKMCRQLDADGAAAASEDSPAEAAGSSVPDSPTSASPDPVQEAPADTKKTGEMSVAEILAAARGQASEQDQSKPKPKPAAKKAAPKPVAADKSATTAKPSESAVPKDTSSILAAARKATKPGPMSKAEAAKLAEADGSDKAKAKTKLNVPPMPEKPAYAQVPSPTAVVTTEDRRGFISTFLGSFLAVGFSALGLTHLMGLLGFAKFMFPNVRIEPPSQFRVGFPDDYASGMVETRFKAQFGVWVVRYEYEGQSQIYALSTVCTHLGCTPNWLEGEQKFKCPCHGSGFYKDGINFEGPAPRPLERYAIEVGPDGQLVVDKSKKFNEEKGQWKDSTSFVPA